jgi:uroporphyrinogen-III synthase
VGPSTKQALLQLSIAESSIHVSPAGNALSLASIIVNEHKRTPFVKPFLFICGDKRLDALPNALSEAKIPLQQLCVYQTQPVSHIALPTAKETATGIEDAPFAVVFFSPSGVSAVMSQHLQTLQCLIDQSKTRIIAIGPTTKSALVSYDLRGASIEMPESPQPDALLRLFATTS